MEAPNNATYLSGKMQNEIISVCGRIIQKQIISKINRAKCFSILADETADVSGVEQFSICARYYDEDFKKLREDFLVFVPATDVTGKGLATKILETLSCLSLETKYLRGQGYDGAASMSGSFNGVKAHILEKYPLAFYIHCTSHSLNLAVSNACSVKSVRNTMGSIQEICVFFRTPKRQYVLETTIDQVLPPTNKKRLKMLCPTRWVERHDAILVFIELYKAILVALDEISEWEYIDTSSKAKRLMIIIEQPEFIITTHIIGKVFSVSMPLSRQLQTENIDLLTALKVVGDVQQILQRFRENVVNDFHNEFLKIEQWCQDLNIDTDFKRLTRT